MANDGLMRDSWRRSAEKRKTLSGIIEIPIATIPHDHDHD